MKFERITPADTPATEAILHTINHLQSHEGETLDPEKVVLVGSAALTLYGVQLQPAPHTPETPRPGDVDLATDMRYARLLEATGHVTKKHGNVSGISSGTVFTLNADLPLPVDVIGREKPLFTTKRPLTEVSIPIEGSDISIAPLSRIKRLLAIRERNERGMSGSSAGQDLRALHEHLRATRRS